MSKILIFGVLAGVIALVYFSFVSNKVLIEPVMVDGFVEYSKCSNDSDCILAQPPTCSSCGCGVYINKSQAERYNGEMTKMCQDYSGSVCGMAACPKTQGKCKMGVCVGIAKNYNILNNFVYLP